MRPWLAALLSLCAACGVEFHERPPDGTGGAGGSDGGANAGGNTAAGGTGEGGMGGAPACRALTFDGNDDLVRVPDHPGLDLGALTVEAWIKPESYPSEVQILSHHDHGARDGYVLLIFSGGEMQFRLYNDAEQVSAGFHLVTAGAWHHVAGTYDGDYIRNYIDGALVHEQQLGAFATDDYAGLLAIGRGSAGGFPFHGIIDEVRLSNVARYAGQAFAVPTEDFEVDDDTVALWHFDGQGQAVTDATTIHHGTLGMNATAEALDPQRVDVPCVSER